MDSENCKVVQNRKQLFSPKWRFKPFKKLEEICDVTTLSLCGFLRRDDILKLGKLIDKEIKQGMSLFVIDFSKLTHLHYKDVHRLLNIKERIKNCDGEVKFVANTGYLIDILLVGGWPFILSFYPSKKSAIDALRKEHSLTWRENGHYSYSGSLK